MLKYSLTNPISDPDFSSFPPTSPFQIDQPPLAQFLILVFKFSLHILNMWHLLISPLTQCSPSSTTVPMHLLSPHCTLRTPYLTQCTPYTNFLLSTTPFPPVSSNIRNNVTIILFRRYLTILCHPLPFPPQYIRVIASRICAPLDPLIRPRRELRSLPHAHLLGTGTSHTISAPCALNASYLYLCTSLYTDLVKV